ncbi:MAG: hypothetical protein ABIH89_09340 [Elusimicrobiota bacterium]
MKLARLISTLVMAVVLAYAFSSIRKTSLSGETVFQYIKTAEKLKAAGGMLPAGLTDKEKKVLESWISKDAVKPDPAKKVIPVHAGLFSPVRSIMSIIEKDKKPPESEAIAYSVYIFFLRFSVFNLQYAKYYIIAGASVVILNIIFGCAGFFSYASFIGRLAFLISRLAITIVSLLIVLSWIMVKPAFATGGVPVLLYGPAAILFFSCVALKFHDPNSPVWNRVVKSMIMPLLACCLSISSEIFMQ